MASSSRFTRRQLSIDCEDGKDNVLQMVVPHLYIGSIYAALEKEQMKEKGITHILNASRFQSTFPEDFTYLSIDIKDKEDCNILPCIPSANIFIEAGMQSGGVLVHCYGGRSRSAAFVASYMMSSSGLSYDEVYRSIKQARPTVAINRGFELCLRAYAQTNHDVYSAHQVLLKGRIRHLHAVRARSKAARRGEVSGHKRSFGETESDNMFKSPRNTVEFYRSPKCVLSKPGSSSLRIMPPLRGLDRSFCCSWCGALLFNMSNVIRLDLDIVPILENLSEPKGDCGNGDQKKHSPIGGGAMAMDIDEGRGDDVLDSTFLYTDKDYSSFAQSDAKSMNTNPFSPRLNKGNVGFGTKSMGNSGGEVDDVEDDDPLDMSTKSDDFEYCPDMSIIPPRTSRASAGAKGFDFDGPVPQSKSGSGDGDFSFDDANSRSDTKLSSSPPTQTRKLQLPLSGIISDGSTVAPLSARAGASAATAQKREGPSIKDYESPRIPVPAGRLRESWSPQQQTTEKRRWLARINLLDRPGSAVSEPVAQLAKADDEAAVLGFGEGKYIHLEYLPWMGPEVIHGENLEGDVTCHSCKNVLGSWGWNPHPRHTMNGRLETPLFRVLKHAVQEFDAPLDETPAGTPRRPSTSEQS